MKMKSLPLHTHLILLLLFGGVSVAILMMPVFLMGFPFRLAGFTPHAKEFLETGILLGTRAHLAILLRAAFSPLIPWNDPIGWALLSSSLHALTSIVLWWCTYRLFNTRIAWVTAIVYSLLPVYWIRGMDAAAYGWAFLILFIGFALFIELRSKHELLAFAGFGACFGAALAAKNVFIAFIPWMVVAYLYWERLEWKRAIRNIVIAGVACFLFHALPSLPNAIDSDKTLSENIAVVLSFPEGGTPTTGHLYPDKFIYEFYRDDYDNLLLEKEAQASFLEKQHNKHYRYIFGVGDTGIVTGIKSSVWLFLNTFPQLLQEKYLGGAFMWIFALVGIVYLAKSNKKLLLSLLGLWISMEFWLRFVLHFSRSHLMDIGWAFALFVGIGVIVVCDTVDVPWKKTSGTMRSIIVTILIAVSLLQSNRFVLERHYERSIVPKIYAAKESLESVPDTAVIAHAERSDLLYFSDHQSHEVHPSSVEFLHERGKLSEPFDHYGITHIIGYSDEQVELITAAVPHISIIEADGSSTTMEPSPLLRYLLNLIR